MSFRHLPLSSMHYHAIIKIILCPKVRKIFYLPVLGLICEYDSNPTFLLESWTHFRLTSSGKSKNLQKNYIARLLGG